MSGLLRFNDISQMKSSRVIALLVLLLGFAFNEWAFRFIFPLEPIDSFLRLMTLVLDLFLISFGFAFVVSKHSFGTRLKNLLQNNSRSVSLFLGLFFSYCILMAVEFGCRYYFKLVYQAPYSEKTYWEPSAIVPDSTLGSALHKDTVISHAYVINDSLIYRQNYRTDKYGRRINPSTHADSTYSEFVMVTGCSFAFGYGLSESETLSHYLDSVTGRRAYNYGVSGHGTQQTLAILQSRELAAEISEQNGVLVHFFIDDHLPRLIGSRRLIKLWASNYPYYYLEDGELKRDGSFWTGRHLQSRFYRAISQSAFVDLFDIDFPLSISNRHLELFGAVLHEAKKEFKKQYPKGQFLVVIGPNSTLAKEVTEVLEAQNVKVLDLSALLDKEDKQYKIHWTEAHPNNKYYLEVALAIDSLLRE